ncbi:MAG: hypothetical protein CMF49_03890, partial [Legionellales bacterium]|nr:hypothetical protein [Legionellales bacterium]
MKEVYEIPFIQKVGSKDRKKLPLEKLANEANLLWDFILTHYAEITIQCRDTMLTNNNYLCEKINDAIKIVFEDITLPEIMFNMSCYLDSSDDSSTINYSENRKVDELQPYHKLIILILRTSAFKNNGMQKISFNHDQFNYQGFYKYCDNLSFNDKCKILKAINLSTSKDVKATLFDEKYTPEELGLKTNEDRKYKYSYFHRFISSCNSPQERMKLIDILLSNGANYKTLIQIKGIFFSKVAESKNIFESYLNAIVEKTDNFLNCMNTLVPIATKEVADKLLLPIHQGNLNSKTFLSEYLMTSANKDLLPKTISLILASRNAKLIDELFQTYDFSSSDNNVLVQKTFLAFYIENVKEDQKLLHEAIEKINMSLSIRAISWLSEYKLSIDAEMSVLESYINHYAVEVLSKNNSTYDEALKKIHFTIPNISPSPGFELILYKYPTLLTNIYQIKNKEDIAAQIICLLNKKYYKKDNSIVTIIHLLQNAIKDKIINIDEVVKYLNAEKNYIIKQIASYYQKRSQESLATIIDLYKLQNSTESNLLCLDQLNNKTIFSLLITETNIAINEKISSNPYALFIVPHLNKIKNKDELNKVIEHLLSLNVFFINYALLKFYQADKKHEISKSIENFISANKENFILQWLHNIVVSQSILSFTYCKSFYTENIENENFNTILLRLITNESLKNSQKTKEKKEGTSIALTNLILSPLNIHDKIIILSKFVEQHLQNQKTRHENLDIKFIYNQPLETINSQTSLLLTHRKIILYAVLRKLCEHLLAHYKEKEIITAINELSHQLNNYRVVNKGNNANKTIKQPKKPLSVKNKNQVKDAINLVNDPEKSNQVKNKIDLANEPEKLNQVEDKIDLANEPEKSNQVEHRIDLANEPEKSNQ